MIKLSDVNLEEGIPNYCCLIPKDRVELLKHCKMEIHEVEGKTLFEVRDKDGKPTGDLAFFVIFK